MRLTAAAALWTVLIAVLVAPQAARADVFHLSGGGTIEGELVRRDGEAYVVRLGSGTVTLGAEMVADIEKAPSPAEQYRERLARVEPTAQAHVELAEWCEDKYLSEEARYHYVEAIKLDGDNPVARAGLGFVKVGGEWVRRSEVRKARSERAAKATPQRQPTSPVRRRQWQKEIRDLSRGPLNAWAYSEEYIEARDRVLAIDDPAAVPVLCEELGRQGDAQKRTLLVDALARISGDAAALALVDILARDADDTVASKAREALAGIESPRAMLEMNNLMRSGGEQARARVAPALGDAQQDAMDAVPNLIRNLITREERIVHHEPTESQRAWISVGTHQAYVSDLDPVVAQAAVGWDPVISYLVSGAILDVKATVLPWEEHFWVTVRHPAVLDSLQRITGQDFGWDIRAWQRWYYTEYLPYRTDQTK